MFVIFGLSPRWKQVGKGRFQCPYEARERAYKQFQESEWFSLFFIPLFKWRDGGEYVECQGCGSRYPKTVLKK